MKKNITNGLEVINQLNPKIYDKSKTLNVEEDTHADLDAVIVTICLKYSIQDGLSIIN